MINIFIGLSNNQIKNYEELTPVVEKGERILITSKSLKVKKDLFSKIIYTNQSLNNQSDGIFNSIGNIISKIKAYKNIIKELDSYKNEKNIRLYFTYIEDILTNYLLFSFNKNLKGIVVEDGTLNYYNHTITYLKKEKVYLKKILCELYRVPFKIYKGHSSGIEYNHVVKQYVRSPELSLFPNKSESLPYKKRNTTLTNSILIIGQEAYINEQGKELYLSRLKQLLEEVKNNSLYSKIDQIYYKPHRNGARINYNLINTSFKNKSVEILDSDTPLEDLYFNKIASKFIYSFDSSALLNIYLEAEKEIQEQIEFNVLLKYKKELKPIFEKFNFRIIE